MEQITSLEETGAKKPYTWYSVYIILWTQWNAYTFIFNGCNHMKNQKPHNRIDVNK